MNTLQRREGTGQQVSDNNLNVRSSIVPKNGNPYYNPNTYLNSGLNMPGKRSYKAPTNFIGIQSFRTPNQYPCATFVPQMNKDPKAQGLPILTTPQNPRIYH